MVNFPASVSLASFIETAQSVRNEWRQATVPLGDEMSLDMLLQFRQAGAPLLVLMPAAQSRGSRQNPVFHRWAWADSFPSANILVLSEPTLYKSDSILGGWLMSSSQDLAKSISREVKTIAHAWGTEPGATLYYGSSMGGFEAIQLAALDLHGNCVAEVPQLDMMTYEFPQSLEEIERHLLDTSFLQHRKRFPEQVSVVDRIRSTQRIPRMRLLTNSADSEFENVLSLGERLSNVVADSVGSLSIDVAYEAVGHKPLPRDVVVPIINDELDRISSKPNSSTLNTRGNDEISDKVGFRERLQQGLDLANKVEFTRTRADRTIYLAALDSLYAAADIDETQDIPLRRACALLKSWELRYSPELFETAKRALARKESIEAASYVCRGILSNDEFEDIDTHLSNLRSTLMNPEVLCVVDIFRAIAAYSAGDLIGYERSVDHIRDSLEPSFSTYMLIPFSTVATTASIEQTRNKKHQFTFEIDAYLDDVNQVEYSLVASCDLVYLEAFGQFLISSFDIASRNNSILVIVVLGSEEDARPIISNYGVSSKRVKFVFIDTDLGANVGPVSSLVRFLAVPELLARTNAPVLLLDIDAVIKQDPMELINASTDGDIALRILGGNLAPWERYAAGIVVFQSSEAAMDIANYVREAGLALIEPGSPQWWIDQNALEYGIRKYTTSGHGAPKLVNLLGVSTDSLVLPVGPKDTKVTVLRNALSDLQNATSHIGEI